jgi:pimeloyl-ACP methyl ester carboxylesterase
MLRFVSRSAPLRSLVLAASMLAATLAGCAIGPSDRPAVAVRDAPLPPGPPATTEPHPAPLPSLPQPSATIIPFEDCTTQTRRRLGAAANRPDLTYQCGSITVPLSPGRRPGGEIEIALLRVGTGVPLVIVGDVGGEPGRLLAARLANQLPASLLTTFALIGVDRRGTGGSEGIRCIPSDVREQLVSIDPGGKEPARTVLDAAREAAQQCVQEIDEMLSLVDSLRSANDLEQLRQKLRTERLNAIALGDGARVLTAYLETFTNTAGRIVLDGAPDPGLDAIAAGQDQAAAAEVAFDAFATSCAARPGCPLGAEPRATVQALADRLRAQPLTTKSGLIRVDAGTMYTALLIGLAEQQQWPALVEALRAAEAGDADGLAELVKPLLQFEDEQPPRLDAALLTMCNDTVTRVPQDRAEQLADDWRTRSPLFGPLFALRLLACAASPVPTTMTPPPRAPDTPPVLLLGAEGDPITPLTGTRRMADALPGGVLLTWQGHGHAALPRTQCATTAVQRFLVDGQVPRNGTVCPP